jgi:ribosomal protein L28
VWYNTNVKFEFVKGGKKMSKRCAICDKTKLFGNKVTFSHRKSSRSWGANIRKVRVVVDGSVKKINVCTTCLKSGFVERPSFTSAE